VARRIEVTKGLFGRYAVGYDCLQCGTGLKSPIDDAGKDDACPECGSRFKVPGLDHRERLSAEKAKLDAHQAEIKSQAADRKQRRQAEQERSRQDEREARQLAEIEGARAAAPPPFETSSSDDEATTPAAAPRRFPKKSSAAVLLCLIVLYSWGRNQGLRAELKRCESYGIVDVSVYYRGYLSTRDIVFDFQTGAAKGRRIDPVHLLMQFASRLNLAGTDNVYLARDGDERFRVASRSLDPLASSYENGGRIWAFNNLPAAVRRIDGSQAYGEWTGGWLGVMKGQVEDLGSFLEQWLGG
jgi:DNA-directed RNA polymerase subunit RPC12/RpoP